MNRVFWRFQLLILVSLLIYGCKTRRFHRELIEVKNIRALDQDSKYIKTHMNNGYLYVLNSWLFMNDSLFGYGNHMNPNRMVVEIKKKSSSNSGISREDSFGIPLSQIALLETNDTGGLNPGIPVLGVAAASTLLLGLHCAANPKDCFGSCPTYYTYVNDSAVLQAEGFSSSISRHLEKEDIDKIWEYEVTDNSFKLLVKNEALETHLIKSLDLVVCKKEPGTEIIRTSANKFFQISGLMTPAIAYAEEGDILDLICSADDLERFSLADSKNLLATEKISFHFDAYDPSGQYGLVISSRQSLMTTFLFYQSIALFGHSAGTHYAELENERKFLLNRTQKMFELLGGIEVWQKSENGRFKLVGNILEMGPIATDQHLIMLESFKTEDLEIELRMTKGLWRLNQVNLARIENEVSPYIISPHKLMNGEEEERNSLDKLLSNEQYLVTMPGDEYELQFVIPDDVINYELFVKSKGYYIEWLREDWFEDEDLASVYKMYMFPRRFYKKMAPDYKIREKEMETIFWNSRYVK